MTSDNETEMTSGAAGKKTYTGESDYMFNSAARAVIANDIVRDICNMVPVLVISGEKGEGKSTLCQMVATAIPSEWITIVFAETVESFEDVVRQIAMRIGCGDVDVSRKAMNGTIDTIGEKLADLGQKVVIMLDEAERIYLATLERVRRMLDQLNDDSVRMQVVLCGRPLLLDNLKQLSIVEFKEVPEKKYFLEPLSVGDVGAYIDQLVAMPDSGVSGSFLPAAIQQIHTVTGGNIGAVRQCVLDICGSDNRDAALAALVERTEAGSGGYKKIKVLVDESLERLKTLPRRTRLIGGGVCIGLVLLLLLFPGDDDKKSGLAPETQNEPIISTSEQGKQKAQQEEPSVQKQVTDSSPINEDTGPDSESTANEATAPPVDKGPAAIADRPAEPKTHDQVADHKDGNQEVESPPQAILSEDTVAVSVPARTDDREQSREPSVDDTDTNVVLKQDMGNASEPQVLAEPVEKEVAVTGKQAEEAAEPEVEGAIIIEDLAQEEQEVPVSGEEEATGPESELAAVPITGEVETSVVEAEVEESTPVTVADSPAVENKTPDLLKDEDNNSLQEDVIPLIKSGVYKRLVAAEHEQPVESGSPVGSESSIVISSLAESEKREIALIPKNTYKIIKEDEIQESVVPEENALPEKEDLEISTPLPPVVLEQETVPPAVQQPETKEDVERRIEKPVLAQPILPVPSPQLPVTGSGATILDNRMEAGYPWLTGRRDDRYTMQLMMLSSEDAEDKIKGILSQREYGRASDNFYIFRKNSNPPVYFVFYGEYRNMTEARNARNSIPVFLRNHRPYVLSVPSAMRKVKL